MKFFIEISCFLVLAVALTCAKEKKGPSMYKFRFLRFDKCNDTNTAIYFENLIINRVGMDDYILTGNIDVAETSYGPLYMGANVKVCPPELSEPCVHSTKVIEEDICEALKHEDSYAYDLLNNTFNIPSPSCPLEKHIYDIETNSVDMTQYEYVVDKGKRWQIELIFYKADKITKSSCLFLEILIEPKSKKERTRDQKKWKKQEKESEEE